MSPRLLAALACLASLVEVGCLWLRDPAGRGCDDAHPCREDRTCHYGRCVVCLSDEDLCGGDGGCAASLFHPQRCSFVPATAPPVLFADDFELGTLVGTDSPPGRWDRRDAPVPENVLVVTAEAAHDGDAGFRLLDAADGGPAMQNRIEQTLTVTNVAHLRLWLRPQPTSTSGHAVVFSARNQLETLAELAVFTGSSLLGLRSFTAGTTGMQQQQTLFSPGQWVLVELALEGLTTGSGVAGFWVDGQQVARHDGRTWTGNNSLQLMLGEPWSDPAATGTFDFDDVRISREPMPSRLALSTQGTGPCRRVLVTLRTSPGDAVASSRAHTVDLADAEGGTFHPDPSCAQPAVTQALVVPRATGALTFHLAGPSGAAVLSARSNDLLGASVVVP